MAAMLKKSTAATILIGPFVSDTDGKTPATALTINTADVLLSKAGSGLAAKNSATATTHSGNGFYLVSLNTTDTATNGRLVVSVKVAGALSVWHEFSVVPAHIFDTLVTGTQADGTGIPCDLRAINGQLTQNGTASLSLKNLRLMGDASYYGLDVVGAHFSGGMNGAQPAFMVESTAAGVPAAYVNAAGTNAPALSVTSVSGPATVLSTSGVDKPALSVRGGPSGDAAEFIGGQGTGTGATATGGNGISLIAGIAQNPGQNGGTGNALRAEASNGDAVSIESTGTTGTGIKTVGSPAISASNRPTVYGPAILIDGKTGNGIRIDAADRGILVNGGTAVDIVGDIGVNVSGGTTAVKIQGADEYSVLISGGVLGAVRVFTDEALAPAISIESTSGPALFLKTELAPEAGPGDVAAVMIVAPEHMGVSISSDAECFKLRSVNNPAIDIMATPIEVVTFPAVKIQGPQGLSIGGSTSYGLSVVSLNTSAFAASFGPSIFTGGIDIFGRAGFSALNLTKGSGALWDFNADSISETIAALKTKLPAGFIASQTDVQSIINNTTFVTTIPETALKPATGSTAYRIRALVYDNAGNMEATDNGIGIRLTSMTNASLNGRLFKDQALTIPATVHGDYAGFVAMLAVSGEVGAFEIWYKSSSTDFAGPVLVDFKYAEDGHQILQNRMTQVVSVIPGEAVLSDSAANKEVIAKAVRNYVPTATLTTGSIEQAIRSDVAAVKSTADATLAKSTEVSVDVDALSAEVAKIVAKLPEGSNLISSLTMATATVEGTSLGESLDLVRSALRGKMTKDGNTLTFYKKDGTTPLFRVVVTDTARTPV